MVSPDLIELCKLAIALKLCAEEKYLLPIMEYRISVEEKHTWFVVQNISHDLSLVLSLEECLPWFDWIMTN